MPETSTEAAWVETPAERHRHGERSKRFRFKSRSEDDRGEQYSDRHKRRRHHSSSHSPRKRHQSSRRADNEPQQPPSSSYLPSDQAFRESLFDAMGDDEGAAFWENVYGQPIHNYPNTYEDEETGELERMTDEEYAQFVRRKMWEKSWEGIEAAKEEKRKEREREKQRIREEEENTRDRERQDQGLDYIFNTEIEASLRRGERRKKRKRWQHLWEGYLRQWNDLQALAQSRQKPENDTEQVFLRNKIAWPVESGEQKDITKEGIERFVRKGTASYDTAESIDPFANAIKTERVRWHPDKIQQRYGFMQIDENTLKKVTATFQVLDDIWAEIRNRAT